ncbi:MAG TPA: YcxB family protein [Gammaproteobacteria bacterium]|nr:YcxB family protein [Xanthomonadales bacterium]MCB1593508.1 YcxB family protein [Xanthomonadales bacterium]HOP21720.1 YcxB family protein [Gammaproteobacteria bacterium]HPI95272.1 YcxB family protein [Gammaproteobacteria bacterium]HPQ86661.1 YcxB family protein [Gammaproteobacteria bacterium]
MKFKIEISKDNIDSYSNYVTNKFKVKTETNTKVAWLGNMVWVFGILSLYSIYSFYDENCCSTFKELNIAILFMALTALTYWIWYKLYMKIYYNNQSLYDQISLGFWEIELDEEGLCEKNDSCEFHYKWKCFIGIEYDEKHCYLFIGSLRAVILPKNQLPDNCESFIKERLLKK